MVLRCCWGWHVQGKSVLATPLSIKHVFKSMKLYTYYIFHVFGVVLVHGNYSPYRYGYQCSCALVYLPSPSLMYLSQSVLSCEAMLTRVAHELCHSWFGLMIGARDWHEEWLSEGFATYLEALVHAAATQVCVYTGTG